MYTMYSHSNPTFRNHGLPFAMMDSQRGRPVPMLGAGFGIAVNAPSVFMAVPEAKDAIKEVLPVLGERQPPGDNLLIRE